MSRSPQPILKPEKAPESGTETSEESAARNSRNAAAILKVDALNAEARRKGLRIGHGCYYHEVDNSVKSRLYLSLGEEATKKLKLKHPKLDLGAETVKSLVEKLDAIFKVELNITYERLQLFTSNPKQNEGMETFHNALAELAKTCDLGTLEQSLVKDLFVAKMSDKELQMKFIREKTSSDQVLEDIILYERGAKDSNFFQQTAAKQSQVAIKQEPTFAIGRQPRGRGASRGSYKQKRGSGVSKKPKSDQCRNCGGKWPHENDCPAKGKECSLCKR